MNKKDIILLSEKYKKEILESHLGDLGTEISIFIKNKPTNRADALMWAKEIIDKLRETNIKKVLEFIRENDPITAILKVYQYFVLGNKEVE